MNLSGPIDPLLPRKRYRVTSLMAPGPLLHRKWDSQRPSDLSRSVPAPSRGPGKGGRSPTGRKGPDLSEPTRFVPKVGNDRVGNCFKLLRSEYPAVRRVLGP